MGANFINSCLEEFAEILKDFLNGDASFFGKEKEVEIIMSILSNYTPDCLVKCYVECDIEELGSCDPTLSPEQFAMKFERAIKIAQIDPHRATTHNKGIFNGIDAVVLATGNDFRAVEACGHTFAARNGHYTSLTDVSLENGKFKYSLSVPLALGTVGGLTTLHPLAQLSLEMLGNPKAEELMMIVASVGLANNFGAIKSLITKGIQQGHMKMHLLNILNHFKATENEKKDAVIFFQNRKVSFAKVAEYLANFRN
jgi:hydroxymethylglutaryl-CoA reductase